MNYKINAIKCEVCGGSAQYILEIEGEGIVLCDSCACTATTLLKRISKKHCKACGEIIEEEDFVAIKEGNYHTDCFEDMKNTLRQVPGTSESSLKG